MMGRPMLSIVLVCCLCGSAVSSYCAWRLRVPAIRLVVDQPMQELGTVARNSTYDIQCELSNAGAQPIEIMSVESSCSCTAAALSENQIAPGDSLTMRAKLSTGSRSGPLQSQVAVVYRQPGSTQLYRQVVGIVAVVE